MALASDLPKHLHDAIHMNIVLANARRMASRRYGDQANWVIAMNVFGLGSSYAFELCRVLGLDPEAKGGR